MNNPGLTRIIVSNPGLTRIIVNNLSDNFIGLFGSDDFTNKSAFN